MFVKNLTKDVLTIRKNGNVLKLQPGMNCVDEAKWSAENILNVYGNKYVTVINRDVEEMEEITPVEETPVENETETPATPIEAPVAPVETPATPTETPVEGEGEKPAEGETEKPAESEGEKPAETKAKRNTKNSNKNK